MANEAAAAPTCFHSRLVSVPPPSWRRRNEPTSIMKSKTRSVTIVTKTVSLLCSVLVTTQADWAGNHPERACEWGKHKEAEISSIETNPDSNYDDMRFGMPLRRRKRDLHSMRNAVLFNHKPNAIHTMTFFLFQMAMLEVVMSARPGTMAAAQQ